jgi:hypothetical protein
LIPVVLFRGGKFMEGVPGVTLFTTQPKLSAIQKKIQKMCKWTKGRVVTPRYPVPDVARVMVCIRIMFDAEKENFERFYLLLKVFPVVPRRLFFATQQRIAITWKPK